MSDDDLSLSGYSSGREPPPRVTQRWERPIADDDYARWREQWELDVYRRRARRSRPVLALFLAALAVFCMAFAVAPLFAFRAVRSAAQFGDVQALNQSVDYDAMRQSLRVQIRPASVERAPPTSVFRNPLDALRRAWEPVTPQADVNAYLSTEALASMMSGQGPTGVASEPRGLFGGPLPRVRYWGFERARLGVVDPQQRSRETVFTFQRRGLFDWRLVGVRLPQQVDPGGATAAGQ